MSINHSSDKKGEKNFATFFMKKIFFYVKYCLFQKKMLYLHSLKQFKIIFKNNYTKIKYLVKEPFNEICANVTQRI